MARQPVYVSLRNLIEYFANGTFQVCLYSFKRYSGKVSRAKSFAIFAKKQAFAKVLFVNTR